MNVLSESDALHARVQGFARRGSSGDGEAFDALALDIARFQVRHVPGFRRLVEAHRTALDSVAAIPAVPVDAFRLTRVAAHSPELDTACFSTSGTTGGARGRHPLRRTDTYRALSLAWGARMLAEPGSGPRVVVSLAPPPGTPPTSSLGFMMRVFLEEFDGRGIDAGFDAEPEGRWLAQEGGIDLAGLERLVELAQRRGEPLLVLSTSFALVLLLDALAGRRLPAPPRTLVMTTGGFKGRTRELSSVELRRDVACAFGISEDRVVGEYGMTELTSQLYEGTAPGAAVRGPSGVFLPPPWLRVSAVDRETLRPVPKNGIGLARFVDLGNIDSAVAIVTQDLIRPNGNGVELLGRSANATPRGCSLAIEEMVLGA